MLDARPDQVTSAVIWTLVSFGGLSLRGGKFVPSPGQGHFYSLCQFWRGLFDLLHKNLLNLNKVDVVRRSPH